MCSGDDFRLVVPQFQQYYDSLVEGLSASQQYDNLLDYRISRFQDSINNNPNFFYSPFSGILVSPAGFSFPVRMMSNHSAQFPEGSLTKEQLKTFFAISGDSGNFKYTEGNERIPDNWYKRAIGDEYTIPGFLADVLNHGAKYPPFLSTGGNLGKTNTFAPVDIGSLTGGVYNSKDFLKGNNLICFLLQASMAATPDILGGSSSDVGNLEAPFTNTVAQRLLGLGCPKLEQYNQDQFQKYPGYNQCPSGCSGYKK